MGPGGVEVGEIFQMVFEVVGGAGTHHQVDRLAKPPRQVGGLLITRLVSHLPLEGRRLGRMLAAGGGRPHQGCREATSLPEQIDRLHRQAAQAHTKQADLEILDPVAGQVPHDVLVGDHPAVDQ